MDNLLEDDIIKPKEKSIVDIVLFYLTVILKYKWFIIIITVLIGVITTVFLVFSTILPSEKSPLPNTYSASIVLYVQSEGSSGLESLFSSSFQDSAFESLFSGIDIGEIAVAVIRSGSFLDEIVEQLDIKELTKKKDARKIDYRKFILSRISINYDNRRRVLGISCVDINPTFTRDMVNQIAKNLIKWFTETGGTKKANMKNIMEEKLVEITEEISKLETQIQTFQKKYGVLTPSELATIHATMLTDLNTEILSKELEIKNYSDLIKIQDSRSRRLKIERDNILDLIGQIENGYTATQRILPPKNKVPDLLLEFNQLEMNLQIQRNIYETLLEEYEILKLSAGIDNIFQVLEWAEIPAEKSGPSRISILGISIVMAVVCAVGIALLHYFIKKMKNNH